MHPADTGLTVLNGQGVFEKPAPLPNPAYECVAVRCPRRCLPAKAVPHDIILHSGHMCAREQLVCLPDAATARERTFLCPRYPIGLGIWYTYCKVDTDCPLFDAPDKWNRTQRCVPSLNPAKNQLHFDTIFDA